jgi:hypothetical protein
MTTRLATWLFLHSPVARLARWWDRHAERALWRWIGLWSKEDEADFTAWRRGSKASSAPRSDSRPPTNRSPLP